MASGNCSALVVVDSRQVRARARADVTLFAALDHFGVPHEILECGDYWSLPPNHVRPRALYVLAHDGAGAGMKPEVATELAAAVAAGAGFVSFDRQVRQWPAALQALAPVPGPAAAVAALRFPDSAPGFIAFGHQPGEEVSLAAELACTTLAADGAWQPLLLTAQGNCVAAAGRIGNGRSVVFGSGEELYSEEVFGHVRGLDGLMWRALVWAAAKPFAMRCLPPYVSARMDDCHGTYSAFRYVDVLNRHGIGPNLGLFIDELGPTDWAAAKRLFDRGGADFSMHAFRDDFYKASPKWRPFAVLADKPDLSAGGRETRFEGLSLDHVTGRDLDAATVRRNFARTDQAFRAAGIRQSRVLNAHYGEIGWRAIPHFLERGIDLPCNNNVPGQLYGNQPLWRPRPYGVRGRNGRYGLIIDRLPQHAAMTCVGLSLSHVGKSHMATDILSGRTPFMQESAQPQPAEAAQVGIDNIRLGLDSLAFGVIMAHEERIDAISLEHWEWIVDKIMQGIQPWDPVPCGREQLSVICKRLLDTSLVRAERAGDGALDCEFTGQSDGPSPLTIWQNDGNNCAATRVEVPAVDGFTAVRM